MVLVARGLAILAILVAVLLLAGPYLGVPYGTVFYDPAGIGPLLALAYLAQTLVQPVALLGLAAGLLLLARIAERDH